MKESKYGFVCHKANTKCMTCKLCSMAIKFKYTLSKETDENGFAIFYYKGDKSKTITCNEFLKKVYHAEVILAKDYYKYYSYKRNDNLFNNEGLYCHNAKGDYRCCEDCDAFDYALCLGYKPHGHSANNFKQFIGPHGDIQSCEEIMQKGCGVKILKLKSEMNLFDIDLIKERIRKVSDQMAEDSDKISQRELERYRRKMNQLAYEKWQVEQKKERDKERQLRLDEKEARQREVIQDKINKYYEAISQWIYNPELHELYNNIYDAPVCCGDCSECDIVPIYQARGIIYKKPKSYRSKCHQFALGSQNEIMKIFGFKYLGEVLNLKSETHDGLAPFLDKCQILNAMKDLHPELCPSIIDEKKGDNE